MRRGTGRGAGGRRPGPAAKARRARSALPAEPSLVVAGEADVASKVVASLSDLQLALVRAASLDEALARIAADTAGVVLVAPLPEHAPVAATAALRADPRTATLPVFVVLRDDAGPASVRRLYAAGATAVLEWPREGLLLPRVLLELLAVTPRPRAPRRIDRALARAARARLALVEGVADTVRVEAWRGVLQLSGRVDSLRRKQEVERFAAHVPGARGVVARDLVVAPSRHSDAQVARRVRDLLRDTPLGDTLSVSVRGGHVMLMGIFEDHAALDELLTLLASVRGVRAVTPVARESAAERRRDQRVARQIQRAIERGHPGAHVRVAVLGDVVVLSGRVPRLATRRAIEGLVRLEAPGLARLVDKLEVADGGPG